MLKSHVRVYDESMAEQKRIRENLAYIIEKHDIKVGQEIERLGGEQHISNCNDNYGAYQTYKANLFFKEETAAQRAPKEASLLIKFII